MKKANNPAAKKKAAAKKQIPMFTEVIIRLPLELKRAAQKDNPGKKIQAVILDLLKSKFQPVNPEEKGVSKEEKS